MSTLKNNFYKKHLAILLSTVTIGSTIFQPAYCTSTKSEESNAPAKYIGKQNARTETTKPSDKPRKSSSIQDWAKEHWFISGAACWIAAKHALKYSNIGILTAASEVAIKDYAEKLKAEFNGTVEPNKYTKQQEGAMWCWIACLQGLYKYHGIELSQEEIFEKLYGKSPKYFKVLRLEGKALSSTATKNESSIFSSLTETLHYKRGLIYTKNCKDSTSIGNCILKYYELISQNPFSIIDSFPKPLSQQRPILHMVNVVNINNRIMTIEDPATGLSHKESLDSFCNRYFDNKISDYLTAIEMSTIVEDSNITDETHYFIDPSQSLDFKNEECKTMVVMI